MRSRLLIYCITWLLFATMDGATLRAQDSKPVTPKQQDDVVRAVSKELTEKYVYPETAAKMTAHVRTQLDQGAYAAVLDPPAFAAALTRDLRSVSKDLHLRVAYPPAERRAAPDNRTPRPPIEGAERLAGNVGYVRVNGFAQQMQGQISEAMAKLANAEAIIIDVRENPGGSPAMAMFLAGHFFEKPTLVARIFSRPQNTTTEMWTEKVAEPLHLNKPVYILTSKRTFSAGEAFAYHMKHLGKAQTVGEATGGGAHRVQTENLPHEFALRVPITRPMNVVTGGDWEGTGVLPDVAVAPEKAVQAAHLHALRKLPANPERQKLIEQLGKETTQP